MTYRRLSKRQRLAMLWWQQSRFRDRDALVCDGAIRSGKTVCMTVGFILWSMAAFSGRNFALCGKTIQSLRRNVVLNLWDWLPQNELTITERRSENSLTITGRTGRSNTYFLFGGRDESSYMLIQGMTLAGVLLDEAALMPRSFVEQALARCSVEGSKFWFNCNPEGPGHWFFQEWLDGDKLREKNALHLHFTMEDNPSLPPKIRARYESMYSGVFYDRYVRGLWVASDGLVYPQFANAPERYVIDTPPPIQYAVIGVDFGGTGSAHAFTLTGFTPGMERVVVLDEYYHSNRKDGVLSPKQVEDAFVDFVRRAKARYRVHEARCDSAEQTLIRGLTIAAAGAGLGVEVRNAVKGPIHDRVAFYNSLMAQGRFFVCARCVNTIRALKEAVYDPKKPLEDVRLDDGSTNIDSLDSLEYSTEPVQSDILYLSLKGAGA